MNWGKGGKRPNCTVMQDRSFFIWLKRQSENGFADGVNNNQSRENNNQANN